MERLGSPVVSTVGTAGRISGVENGVRWWLQRSDSTTDDRSAKRRCMDEDGNDVDIEKGLPLTSPTTTGQRRFSEISSETLPPYDAQRSPNYEEVASNARSDDERRPQPHPSWSSRLIRSTSGLGVAMSEESLESLKWALRCLGWANRHLTRLIISLRDAIGYSDSEKAQQPSPQSNTPTSQQENDRDTSEADSGIASNRESHMQALTAEVIWIIKKVSNAVTEYAGSALPENARVLVGRYLKSLRQSFQRSFAAPSHTGEGQGQDNTSGPERSAKKALLLAREALDKLAQVNGIVEGTIVSAEEWCDRLGRRRSNRPSQQREALAWTADEKRSTNAIEGDIQMTGTDDRSSVRSPQSMDAEMTDQK